MIKLSPYAKIFYTEWLLDQGGSRYNVSMDQILCGNLDTERLRCALKRYVAEHLLLSSHIQDISNEPHWIKNDSINELEYSDEIANKFELLDYVSQSFDLYNGPLYRFKLWRINNETHRFIIVLHHLVVDGTSIDAGVFEAISNYYNNNNYVEPYTIDKQIELLTNLSNVLFSKLEQNRSKYKEFWHNQLASAESVDLKAIRLDKNSAKKILAKKGNLIEQILFSYGKVELAKLNQIKLKYMVTPYIFGQCIFALLLHRYTGQEQFIINYPLAIKEGIDFIYGAQININLIPYQFNQATTILDLFDQSRNFFKSTKQDDIKYSYYPITEIMQEVGDDHILDACFIQTHFRNKPFEFIGITKVESSAEFNMDSVAKDMLLFEQELTSNKLNYRVRYNKSVIDKELVTNFVDVYKKLFHEVLEDLVKENNSKLIYDYDLLDQKQYQQIVYGFNKTNVKYPQDKTIHQLFEEQVNKSPDRIAAMHENCSITYRELNEKTNQLAQMMRARGVDVAGTIVGVCMERGLNLLIGLLATIKSGGTYIPLDPIYPSARIKFILEEAKVKLVLTQESVLSRSPALDGAVSRTICLDRDWDDVTKFDHANLEPIHKPSDLMYIIYTSGSTGNPKGVQITHANVANFLVAMQSLFPLCSSDKFLAATTITFDIAGLELYLPLVKGAQTVIVSREMVTNPQALIDFIHQTKITYMQATPSLWSLLVDAGWEGRRDLTILSGGEALPLDLAEILLTKGKVLWNLYGPTETTIWSTAARVEAGSIPHIGKPIANTQIFILDSNKKPIPLGAIGELYIGGDGVGKGYLAREELNAKSFIVNPFDNSKLNFLYKTNDSARYLFDGNIEYLGRRDSQVKLNGYRIELGEIESKIASYAGIKQAVVLVKEYTEMTNSGHVGGKYLVAYYVADSKLDGAQLESYLAKQLPVYMLPSVFVYLEKFPLMINGKLDRKALPEVNFNNTDQYVAPNNEQEHLICEEFAKILGIKKIGINDDFFKLGGNSIKAIALTSILQANFDIKVADIFNLRTPKKLSENSCFGKDVLRQKLEQVKLSFKNKSIKTCVFDEELQDKLKRHLASIDNLQIVPTLQKPIVNVLLTGATGYLGCNILNQLLTLTNYNIFLLVRAPSAIEATNHINKKYLLYFDQTLDSFLNSRVFVINADIEKNDLGLLAKEYQDLAAQIDSIIHSAALVKHYGEYAKFYSVNVKATVNLLDFSKLTKLKDFHHISTYSILNFGFIPNCAEYVYTEDDLPDNLEQWQNVYIQTKLQAEKEVIRYRDYGVNSNIYRVGNLAFISTNYRTQENIDDNAFFSWLKCLFKLQCIAEGMNLVEISQVDLTAQAIVKLFDKKQLDNNIYHVFNPFLFNLSDVFADSKKLPIKTLTMEQFIDNIVGNLSNEIYHELILKFLLHQGWLDGRGIKDTTSIKVLQNRTQHILKQLDFVWSPITNEAFNKYLEFLK